MASSPKKQKLSQRKLSGAASYASYVKEFRCSGCSCNVNCPHQGEADVKPHCDGANHIKWQKALGNTRSLSSFGFTKATDPLVEGRILGYANARRKALNFKEIFGVKTSQYI